MLFGSEGLLEHPSIFETVSSYVRLQRTGIFSLWDDSAAIPDWSNSCDFMGYFWLVLRLLLIIGILCCCSTGYFIRRRVHPYPPPGEPDFNVAFTRHPIISPGTLSVCPCSANTIHVVWSAVYVVSVCWQDCIRLAFIVMETQRLQSFPPSTQCRPTPVTWLQCIQPCRPTTASLLLPMIRSCRTCRRNKQKNTVSRATTLQILSDLLNLKVCEVKGTKKERNWRNSTTQASLEETNLQTEVRVQKQKYRDTEMPLSFYQHKRHRVRGNSRSV